MDISPYIAIADLPGLYKILKQLKNGLIVESLTDQKRFPVYATHKISALEDISVFTVDEDVALVDVFEKIHEHEKGARAIDHKAGADELKAFFAKVLPDYDQDRVYVSDMKKIVRWYNALVDAKALDFSKKEDEADKDDAKAEKTADKPAAKKSTSAAKKTTAKSKSTAKSKEAKPVEKAAKKQASPVKG